MKKDKPVSLTDYSESVYADTVRATKLAELTEKWHPYHVGHKLENPTSVEAKNWRILAESLGPLMRVPETWLRLALLSHLDHFMRSHIIHHVFAFTSELPDDPTWYSHGFVEEVTAIEFKDLRGFAHVSASRQLAEYMRFGEWSLSADVKPINTDMLFVIGNNFRLFGEDFYKAVYPRKGEDK